MTAVDPAAATSTTHPPQRRFWSPVRMRGADNFWIMLIIAMAITVITTRVGLELTGYPQVGDATFHIAHVLWGGLAMFIALVLPLTMANPYTPWLVAILGGIGAGLFMDEVGKFITQTNDYFFPLAFPLIYAFIVICTWLALRLRARRPHDARTTLYHALEELKQVLDNDLDPFEHEELRVQLVAVVRATTDTEERALAEALLSFVQNRHIRLAESPTALEQFWGRITSTFSRLPPRVILRGILILSFGYMALTALLLLVALAVLVADGGRTAIWDVLGSAVIVSGKSRYLVDNPLLSMVQAGFVVVSGLLALVAAIALTIRREVFGLRAGTLSLVISLLIVNLLSFYFSQLYALTATLGQAALLLVATLYRWRFLRQSPSP